MSDEMKTLDLDEMLGEKQIVKIKRGDKEYLLRDIDSFSTHQLLQIQGMRRKITTLQLREDVTEEEAGNLEILLNDILKILCLEMPLSELSYSEKTYIIAFYFMEVRKKKAKKPSQ